MKFERKKILNDQGIDEQKQKNWYRKRKLKKKMCTKNEGKGGLCRIKVGQEFPGAPME